MRTVMLPVWICFVLHAGCTAGPADLPSRRDVDPAAAALGGAFVSRTASVNGTTIHYVRGGSGPGLILLHGFPQDWSVFRRIMPRLAPKFTVVAVDLRGIGGSAATGATARSPSLTADYT